ncbi:MAG: carboxypeptidase regulatory-like domain-containing protein [Candidatus Thermochlorobacter sp.]
MNYRYFLSLFVLLFLPLWIGCSGSSDNPVDTQSELTGQVINTSQIGVRNATVALVKQGESSPTFTTTTNDTGGYVIRNIPSGAYSLRLSAAGYTAREVTGLNIAANARRIDTLLGPATVSGQILNSQTGRGLANATVSFNFGTDTSIVLTAVRAITDANGNFTIRNAPSGTFVCIVRASGFIPQVIRNVVFNPTGTTSLPPSTIVQRPAVGAFRIVLTWGENPRDLDSYLTGPLTGTRRFICYFQNKRPTDSNVELDVDDVTSYGPETITITAFRDGVYRYSVHNYSDQSANGFRGIVNSPALVQVFDNTGLIREFSPPTPPANAAGNTWRVFEINVSGTTRTIVPVNTYVTGNVGDVNTFAAGSASASMQISKKHKAVARPEDF